MNENSEHAQHTETSCYEERSIPSCICYGMHRWKVGIHGARLSNGEEGVGVDEKPIVQFIRELNL